eukprot:2516960-Prymnesium_polylepis.1
MYDGQRVRCADLPCDVRGEGGSMRTLSSLYATASLYTEERLKTDEERLETDPLCDMPRSTSPSPRTPEWLLVEPLRGLFRGLIDPLRGPDLTLPLSRTDRRRSFKFRIVSCVPATSSSYCDAAARMTR